MNALVSAWTTWQQGKLPDSYMLWGLQLYWWGRIGKALQALAIASVIIELAGVERLNNISRAIDRIIPTRIGYQFAISTLDASASWFRVRKDGLAAALAPTLENQEVFMHLFLWKWLLVIFNVLFVLFWYSLPKAIFMLIPAYIAADILCGAAVFLISLAIFLMRTVTITPLTLLFGSKKLEPLVKLFTLILLILGLHFDFLSS